MKTQFSLRQLSPQDSLAFGNLMETSPDTGRFSNAAHFEIDPFEALRTMQHDFVGVVAETPAHAGIVGACLARFGQAQFEGRLRPYALINSLVVDPSYRRQGLASALVGWVVNHSRTHLGDEAVLWALIQQGNVGSVRSVGKYLRQFIGERIVTAPLRMRAKSPKPSSNYVVRSAKPDEFDQVANQFNAFYREFNFFEPATASSLASWCASSPFEDPFRHYLVATNSKGEIYAGAGVSELYRLRTIHMHQMPQVVQFLNTFLRIVPANGITKELVLSKIWFAPGHAQAAKYLIETIRWKWRKKATLLMVWADKKNPVLKILNLPFWMPAGKNAVVIDSSETIPENHLIYYE
ncbi:MAG: GNAT family N-acetyltransferase [Chloroflexota bacterium]